MTQNASPSGLEPAASLMSVRVKRRKPSLTPSGKRGDLTAESGGAALEAKLEAPVIVLPPPKPAESEPPPKPAEIEPAELLPFAEFRTSLPAPAPEEPEPAAPEFLPLAELMAPLPVPEPEEPERTAPEFLPLAEIMAALPAPEPEEPERTAPEFLPLAELMASLPAPEPEEEPERAAPEFLPLAVMPPLPAQELTPANDLLPELADYPELLEGEPLELLPAPHDAAEPAPEADEAADIAAPAPPQAPPALVLLGPPPAKEPHVAEPSAAAPAPQREPDLIDYWDSLRGGRDFPALDELDRAHVAATWPNTVLLAIDVADLPRITRLGASDGEIEYTATVIDWMMSRGRNAAKRGEPIEEERRFPVSTGSARYRLLLLPFASYGLKCDHVLGQLSRGQELGAVASFKRWLAG